MREIKFRMWVPEEDGEPGYMISGDDLSFEEYLPLTQLLSQEGVMQYTGIKDKNRKEIYELEILRVTCYRKGGRFYIYKLVLWNDENARFVALRDGSYGSSYELKNAKFLSEPMYMTEVVGNLYENPELLEVE